MKQGEYKQIGGMIVRKACHPLHRNRDGYAKACYEVYESIEHMRAYKVAFRCYAMPEVKERIKVWSEE